MLHQFAKPFSRLSMRHLKWLAIVLPLAFLAVYYYLMVGPAHGVFHTLPGFLLLMGLLAIGVTTFSHLVFGRIEALQATVLVQNRRLMDLSARLRSLNQAGTALTSEMLLPSVLQRIVDLSRSLLHARFAALALVDAQGGNGTFVTSGFDHIVGRRLGDMPQEREVLDALLRATGPIRVDDVRTHPELAGLLPRHSHTRAFLSMPIRFHGRVLGSIYLADKEEREAFTADDEDILGMFTTQAAIAVENARLYQEVQALAVETERGRIAREMHDGLAQVLTYVNAKAQAVHAFLDGGQVEEAKSQLTELARAARSVYADVREGILALRTQVTGDRDLPTVLREYLAEFESQSGIDTHLIAPAEPPSLGLTPAQELQVLRIVQEALANVRKHAAATEATVLLERSDTTACITISDNGQGFEPRSIARHGRPHFGLQTMRERAESIGGTLTVESAPGEGARVSVSVAVAGDASTREASVSSAAVAPPNLGANHRTGVSPPTEMPAERSGRGR